MQNRVCEMLGIEFPIFAFTHCRDVAAAVSRAGGMGVLGALAFSPEQLELELKWIDEHVDGKPYGVDVVMPVKSADREMGLTDASKLGEQLRSMITPAHWEFVEKILADHGVAPAAEEETGSDPISQGVLGWTEATGSPLIDVALAHPIKLLASALGPPPKEAIDRGHAQDVKVAALVGRPQQAVRDVQGGVDIIVAQGYEAGGHTGEIGGLVLVPDVVDAVGPDIPVLAAGGIGTGRQMAAAMALGADGIWTGSIWLTVAEADTSQSVMDKLLAATSTDTVRSRSMTGKPADAAHCLDRGVGVARVAWHAPDADAVHPLAVRDASVGFTSTSELVGMPVGQIVSRMNSVRTSKDVIYGMVEEFIEASERLQGLTSVDA